MIYCSDEHGDRPRPLPDIPELEDAIDLFERNETPSWDFDVSLQDINFSIRSLISFQIFFLPYL